VGESCFWIYWIVGIWPPCSDGTDINACVRSHKPLSDGYNLLAIGDDFGFVRVLR
jgi:hypothetical protein